MEEESHGAFLAVERSGEFLYVSESGIHFSHCSSDVDSGEIAADGLCISHDAVGFGEYSWHFLVEVSHHGVDALSGHCQVL